MVDQRTIKKFLQDNQGNFFSALEVAKVYDENVRSIFSKMSQLKTDPEIISKQLNVGGKVGIVTMYSFQGENSGLNNSFMEYQVARSRPETRNMHTETVENILIISKLDEIISLLKGVIENGSQHKI